jgi:hypothetical protein
LDEIVAALKAPKRPRLSELNEDSGHHMNPVAPFKNLITTNKRQKVDAEDFLSDFFS